MKLNKSMIAFAVALLIIGGLLTPATSIAQDTSNKRQSSKKEDSNDKEQLAREAKITMEQARETALNRAPGTIESSELEREHGKLVYSFDIRNAKGSITEVQVSAINGKIVSVERENKKKEAAEKRKEEREKKSGQNKQ